MEMCLLIFTILLAILFQFLEVKIFLIQPVNPFGIMDISPLCTVVVWLHSHLLSQGSIQPSAYHRGNRHCWMNKG